MLQECAIVLRNSRVSTDFIIELEICGFDKAIVKQGGALNSQLDLISHRNAILLMIVSQTSVGSYVHVHVDAPEIIWQILLGIRKFIDMPLRILKIILL